MQDKTFELLEKLFIEVQSMKEDVKDIKQDVHCLKNQVTKIEVEHGQKLDALFDGYKQNTEIIKRIEDEVSKHDDIIFKRVK